MGALRAVLGGHIEQQGSYVDAERLRFDFTHNQAATAEEIQAIEDLVNQKIMENIPVTTEVLSLDDAKKTGATAQFDEKYGAEVRVVSIADFDKEFCGGTHAKTTGQIRIFKIVSETGVASGVRRIEALTSVGVQKYFANMEAEMKEAASIAKVPVDELPSKVAQLLEEIKTLKSENQKLKDKLAKNSASDAAQDVVEVGDLKVLPVSVKDVDMNGLRTLGDGFKAKLGKSVIILASDAGEKVNLIVMATDDAVASGVHAGNIVKKIAPMVGGGGGGRPNMAQAGGKNAAGIADCLAAGVEEVKAQLQ